MTDKPSRDLEARLRRVVRAIEVAPLQGSLPQGAFASLATNPFAATSEEDREERAAILEYDHGLPRAEAERLAGLIPPASPFGESIPVAPAGVPALWWKGALLFRERAILRRGTEARAAEIAADLVQLLEDYGEELARLGWTAEQVAGVCPVRPMSGTERAGLAPRLRGRKAGALSMDRADILDQTGQVVEVFDLNHLAPGGRPVWAAVPAKHRA